MSVSFGGLDAGEDPLVREKLNLLRNLYEQRLRTVISQLRDTLSRVQGDGSVATLLADATTAEYAPVRTKYLSAQSI